MKILLTLTSALFLAGCATTEVEKVSQVRALSYAAASVGTQEALKQNTGWRVQFELVFKSLDTLVETKTVTGALLREIIAQLPVKELKSDQARIAIEGATVLFDATVGNKVNLEAQPYVLAAATGIRDGMKVALRK